MKVAAPFELDSKYKDIPSEYNIKYTKSASTKKLIDFCELYPNKRINISFVNVPLNYEALELARKIHPKLTVMLSPSQLLEMAKLEELNIRFFFSNEIPCYSFSLLDMMLAQGVSDIYVSDALCYNLYEVAERCRKKGVRTRLVLNSIASISPNRGVDPKAPFFFPRDTKELAKYIDVFEFDCGEPYDWMKFEVYYDAWIRERFWYGDLNEIVPELEMSYPCQAILPNSTIFKYNCGRKCSIGGRCRRCFSIQNVANTMIEHNFILDKEYQGNSEKE